MFAGRGDPWNLDVVLTVEYFLIFLFISEF